MREEMKCKTVLFILLAFGLAGSLFWRGASLDMPQKLSFQFAYHCVPVALSNIVHGRDLDYAGYHHVQGYFWKYYKDGDINRGFHEAQHIEMDSRKRDFDYFITANDKGCVLYTIAAFLLFGTSVHSLYYAFLLLISVSVVIFVLAYRRNPLKMLILVCALSAFYVVAIPVANSDTFQLGAFHAQRGLVLLGFIALLHLACGIGEPLSWPRTAGFMVQAALVMLAYFIRVSASQYIVALAILTAIAALGAWRTSRSLSQYTRGQALLSATLPMATLIACLLVLTAHKQIAFHTRYFNDLNAKHVFWHSLYLGTAWDARLRDALYGGKPERLDDFYVRASLERYLKAHGREGEWKALEARVTPQVGSIYGLEDYDDLVGEMYWNAWKRYPWSMVRLYAITKPKAFYNTILAIMQPPSDGLPRQASGYSPLDIGVVAALLMAVLITITCTIQWTFSQALIAVGAVSLTAQLPWMAAYPAFNVVPESFLAVTFLFYGFVSIALVFLGKRMVYVWRARREMA